MKWAERISVSIAHLLFLVLMLLSIFLYKERMFADAAYYLFHAINKSWFHIEHGRTVLGFSQLLPVAGSLLHLPLKVVLVLGSLGHELFYYALFLLCLYPLKDKAGAFVVLGIHMIGQLWLYYSPMLEICYGAAIAVAFYSILRSGKYQNELWLMFLLLLQWLVMMSHPENFSLIGVAIAYDLLQRGFQRTIHVKLIGLFVLGMLVEVLTFSEYERGHTEIIGEKSEATALNLFNSEYLSGIGELFTGYFPDLLLLLGIALVLLIKTASWKKLMLLVGSGLFLMIVVNQAAEANDYYRYYESMYNPLVFLAVFFFSYESQLIKKPLIRFALSFLILVIVGGRIYWTYDYGEPLRQRSAQLERLVDYAQQLGHSKYLVNGENFSADYTRVTWANPIETLLYSAIDGKEKSLSISTEAEYTFNRNHTKLNDSNYLFRRFEIKDHSFLNSTYFSLKNEAYHKLNHSNFEKTPEAYKGQVSIQLLDCGKELNSGDTANFYVKIENRASEKLPSGVDSGLRLSYHWQKENGEAYEWDGVRTNLEVDLYGKYEQHLKVALPEEKGSYQFVPDLVVEGKLWFMLSDSFPVEVN